MFPHTARVIFPGEVEDGIHGSSAPFSLSFLSCPKLHQRFFGDIRYILIDWTWCTYVHTYITWHDMTWHDMTWHDMTLHTCIYNNCIYVYALILSYFHIPIFSLDSWIIASWQPHSQGMTSLRRLLKSLTLRSGHEVQRPWTVRMGCISSQSQEPNLTALAKRLGRHMVFMTTISYIFCHSMSFIYFVQTVLDV